MKIENSMDTCICTKPGDLKYVRKPVPERQPGHSIVRIKTVGICGTDIHAFEGSQPYFSYPRILGHEIAAEIMETDDPRFSQGENVALLPYISCGKCIACRRKINNCCVEMQVIGVHVDGALQNYLSVPSDLLIKSEGLGLDELALVEPLAIGAHGIRRAQLLSGEFVLVIGAGPIGLGTMEFARIAGGKVIAMDINEDRLKFCEKELDVGYTIKAGQPDTLKNLQEITKGDLPTVVIDATGNQQAIVNSLNFVAHSGRLVLIGLQKDNLIFSHPEVHKKEATIMSSRNATKSDFDHVISCIKRGDICPSKYITHQIPFRQLKDTFPSLLNSETGVIKAVVNFD